MIRIMFIIIIIIIIIIIEDNEKKNHFTICITYMYEFCFDHLLADVLCNFTYVLGQ